MVDVGPPQSSSAETAYRALALVPAVLALLLGGVYLLGAVGNSAQLNAEGLDGIAGVSL
jgi:hypothetical protein